MAVRVEIEGDRIRLESSRNLKALQRRIPGAYFGRRGGAHWTLPLTVSTLVLLRNKFGSELEYGPNLKEWGWARREKAKRLNALIKMDRYEQLTLLKKNFPYLYKAIVEGRPYQSVGSEFTIIGRGVIIADTVGLGKTAQTIAAVIEDANPGPNLVVTPKTSVETVWAPEIMHWTRKKHRAFTPPEGSERRLEWLDFWHDNGAGLTGDDWWVVHPKMMTTRAYWKCKHREIPRTGPICGMTTEITSKKKELDCEHDGKKTEIVYAADYPQLFEVNWGSVTVDEAHKSLLRRSSVPSRIRRGFEHLKIVEDGLKIVQSATPWASKPYYLWSVLNWLYPDEYTSFWSWVETYYDVEESFGGAREIEGLRADRESLLYKDLGGIILRRTRAEVRSDLPPRMYVGTPFHYGDDNSPIATWIPLTDEQKRIYAEMEDDGVAYLEGGEVQAIGALAELTRLKQFANSSGIWTDQGFKPRLPSNKFDKLLELLEQLGIPENPQGKVVVASQFTELIDMFAAELLKRGISNFKLTGATTPKNRKAIIDQFDRPISAGHKGEACVLFLNTQVGGAAITLDEPEDMVILDESFEWDDQEQLEGRIDNRKPEKKIATRRYHYYKSIDTVDVGISLANAEARGTTHRILDGPRGVTFARRVMELSATANRNAGVQ